MSIKGITVGTTAPSPDYNETNEKHSTYIHNKPDEAIAKAQRTADAALPRSGGVMTGPLSVLEPTEAGHAASRGYVDGKHRNITVQLSAKEWSTSAPHTQRVAVAGILPSDHPHYGVVYSENWEEEKRAFAMVDDLDTADGSVTFTCFRAAPETDLTVQLEVNR